MDLERYFSRLQKQHENNEKQEELSSAEKQPEPSSDHNSDNN